MGEKQNNALSALTVTSVDNTAEWQNLQQSHQCSRIISSFIVNQRHTHSHSPTEM